MTEYDIQNKLYRRMWQSHVVMIPNYHPLDWWECDLFGITNAGFGREWEVKTSREDFKKDCRKTAKHARLARAHSTGPNQFWYVVPEGMIVPGDVPDYAGLIYVGCARSYLGIQWVKRAPRLHDHKVGPGLTKHAGYSCATRYWNLRCPLESIGPTGD